MHNINGNIRKRFVGLTFTNVQSTPHSNNKSNFKLLTKTIITVFFLLTISLLSHQLHSAVANQRFSLHPDPLEGESTKQITAKIEEHNLDLPVRLIIPKINVDAEIEYVGVTAEGEMAVPSNISNVGWYALGPHPGWLGSAVIAGHANGINGEEGVFSNLKELEKGDTFSVVNRKGEIISFMVRESQLFNPGFVSEVFIQSTTSHLNLITCDGNWSNTRRTYDKRLVVFADKVH